MTHIGISIPQGFTVSTEACTLYYNSGKNLPDYLVKEIYDAIHVIEKEPERISAVHTTRCSCLFALVLAPACPA
jgi:phosphoenolpyruvate synthase/pyruvate phosphate dikinase